MIWSGTMNQSLEPNAGVSADRERHWGRIGGAVGAGFGVGSAAVAVGIDGASFYESGPYPEVFERADLLALDAHLLVALAVGAGFTVAGAVYARRSPFPRSDAFGASLVGGLLTTLAGLILFIRLYALVHAG